MTTSDPAARARRLLDAQVAFHLEQLTGDALDRLVASLAGDVLDAGGRHQLEDLVERDAVKTIVTRALVTVPSSAAVSGFVELATSLAQEGPPAEYPLSELVEREQVERLLDEVLALSPVLERALDRLTDTPLVGTMASRFMGRVVGEVMAANKAVADRLPGLGSLVAFGTSAASKMVGAADKQLEGLLGDAVGKGGAFAVRRLNRILIETLQDPTTRAAVLEVWDQAAARPVSGLGEHGAELSGVVDAGHDLVVTVLASEHVAVLAEAVVDGFFDRFGGYTPTELLAELDLDRDELVADLVRMAPAVVDALRESGDLERILRERLEPFYASEEALRILT